MINKGLSSFIFTLNDMNVYDLDGTILQGDSENYFFDFVFKNYLFSFKAKFKFKFYGWLRKRFKVNFNYTRPRQYYFLKEIICLDEVLKRFWDIHICFVHKWYLEQKRDDDIISTASPIFLEEELCRRLNIKNLIGTKMDKCTGKIDTFFNWGVHKVESFKLLYPNAEIENFYSDSYSDQPLAKLANNAYMVDGENVSKWIFK